MRFRRFLPHIKSLFFVGIVVFFLALNSHDNGIPDSLTVEQQEYVVTTCVDWNCQLERVIAGIEDFNAHPDDEAGYAKALVLEMDALTEIGDKIYLGPEFYAGFELEPKLKEKTLRLVNTDLPVAVEEMIEEILRRRDDPNFEVDQTSYDTVSKAMMGMKRSRT